MPQDIYDDIRAMSEELRVAGEEQWYAALDQALSYVGSGSEILGKVRLQLRRLWGSGVSQRLEVYVRRSPGPATRAGRTICSG
jgi:hypothetical protein